MSIHQSTTSSIGNRPKLEDFSSKPWLRSDQTININYFKFGGHSGRKLHSGISRAWKILIGRLFVSPLLLVGLIASILLIPKKFLKLGLSFSIRSAYARASLKRIIDIIGAILGLVLSSMLFIVIPILIKFDSRGKIIYKQIRIGKNRRKSDRRFLSLVVPNDKRDGERRKDDLLGQPFYVYKFRSMKENAEKITGPVWASNNDPRVTRLGHILRRFHLDEIPQFISVLKGEMSLVGPRPERPEFVRRFNVAIPDYNQRFKSKPGLTGLAQIYCGYDSSTEDVYNKLKFDLHYISNGHVKSDILILWTTMKKIISRNGFAGSRDLEINVKK